MTTLLLDLKKVKSAKEEIQATKTVMEKLELVLKKLAGNKTSLKKEERKNVLIQAYQLPQNTKTIRAARRQLRAVPRRQKSECLAIAAANPVRT